MEFGELLKVYGPLAIGWMIAAYLMKFILDRYSDDMDARIKLASALEKLTERINERAD